MVYIRPGLRKLDEFDDNYWLTLFLAHNAARASEHVSLVFTAEK